ncbi:hypothetical protein Tco_1388199, partial [Tanacetum coccineum]
MVTYLKKPEGSEGFHQIETATARTLDNGEIELTATIDGKVKIVNEASGEGSTHPVESYHTPTSALSTSQPLISPTSRRKNRQESVVPQPKSPTQTPVADKASSIGVDVRYGGATTIVIGLEEGQGSGNIDKTLTMPQDSPLLRVNTLRSDEGSMTLQELMVLCTTLSKKVEILKTDLTQTKLTYDAVYTKLIKKVKKLENKVKSNQARRRARIIIQGRHEHDMEFDFDLDAAKDVSTAKPVSTASAAVTIASVAVSTAKTKQEQERLGYEAAIRLQAKLEEEERQRIAKVHKATSSFNVKEWEDIQARVEADEELAQKLQAEEREMYTEAEQARMLVELINQRKRYFAAQRAKERRNKPPTQAQQRTYMSNYIKHQLEVQKEMQKKNLIKKFQRDKRLVKAQNQALGSTRRSSELEIILRFNSTKPTDDKEREIWVELKRLFKPDTDDELWKLQK